MKKNCLIRKICMIFCGLLIIAVLQKNTVFASTEVETPQMTGTVRTSTSIKITWKQSKHAEKYEVYRAITKTGKYKKIKTTSGLTFTDKKLTPNCNYYYKLRAVNGENYSKYSTIKKITTKKDKYDLTRYAGKNFLQYVKDRNIPYKNAGSDGSYETSCEEYVMATSPSEPVSDRVIESIRLSKYINKSSKYSICGVKLGMSMKSAKNVMSKAAGWKLQKEQPENIEYVDGAGNTISIRVYRDDHSKVGVVTYTLNYR